MKSVNIEFVEKIGIKKDCFLINFYQYQIDIYKT
jgi:hypothetical protein